MKKRKLLALCLVPALLAGCAACLPSTVTCSTERPVRGRRIT